MYSKGLLKFVYRIVFGGLKKGKEIGLEDNILVVKEKMKDQYVEIRYDIRDIFTEFKRKMAVDYNIKLYEWYNRKGNYLVKLKYSDCPTSKTFSTGRNKSEDEVRLDVMKWIYDHVFNVRLIECNGYNFIINSALDKVIAGCPKFKKLVYKIHNAIVYEPHLSKVSFTLFEHEESRPVTEILSPWLKENISPWLNITRD